MRSMTIIIPLLASILATAAPAAETENTDDEPLWEVFLAAFGRQGPAYPASEDNEFNLIPLPLPVYRGKVLRLGEDEDSPIKGRLFRSDRLRLDLAADINFSSDSEDIDARNGMPDLDFLLELGPELQYRVNENGDRYRLLLAPQIKVAMSFDGLSPSTQGMVFSPEIQYVRRLSGPRRHRLKFKLTPSFATRDYMEYFYEVEPRFTAPGRPAYRAHGGYLGTEIGLSWRRQVSEKLDFVVGGAVAFHEGAINDDSPLFRDDTTGSVFAAFMWKLWESERRVPRAD